MERKLAAILVADAVGYSRSMSISELETYALVKADLSQIFAARISSAGGRTVKTTGDGVLAEFPSAVGAVNCAVEIQRTLKTGGTRGLGGSGLDYRIGINVGEIIVEPGEIYGDAVNVAVRLQQLAEPGAIAVSAPVRRALGHRADLYIEDLGDRRMKNLEGLVRVHRIRLPRPIRHGTAQRASPGCRSSGAAEATVAIPPLPSAGTEAEACARRGRDLMVDFDPRVNQRAKACFETAIEFDPGLCDAYAGLANAYWREAQYRWSATPEDSLKSALDLARIAVSLEPSDPWAHAVLAAAKLTSGLLNAAIMEFHAALRIQPSHADSLAFLSEALVAAGRPIEAVGCVEKALQFNPAAPDWYLWNLGLACYASGHYDRAIAALRRIARLTEPRRLLAASLAQNGNLDAAHREASDFLATNPNFAIAAWVHAQAFVNAPDGEHFAQGYRRAGLPA